MSVVDVDRLTKSFDGRQALCAVTFSLQPGERLVVAGAPGCGRTTLCRVLMGILAPTSGSARVFGHDALLGGRICRQRTGYMPAQPGLDPELDAAEHVRRRLAHYPRASSQRAGQLLERLGLPAGLCARDMTPLQQRLLGLALALCAQPELLILDEPFLPDAPAGQNAAFARALERELDARTTLLVTAAHADTPPLPMTRALLLRAGRVTADGALERLRLPCRRVTLRGVRADAPELTALRAFGVRSLPDGVSFFFDGGPDELLPALYALHPQALTVEEAGADDLLALAQEGETP